MSKSLHSSFLLGSFDPLSCPVACHCSQEVFVIFGKIVIFIIFVGVFGPSRAWCHCTLHVFVIFDKIIAFIIFCLGLWTPSLPNCSQHFLELSSKLLFLSFPLFLSCNHCSLWTLLCLMLLHSSFFFNFYRNNYSCQFPWTLAMNYSNILIACKIILDIQYSSACKAKCRPKWTCHFHLWRGTSRS